MRRRGTPTPATFARAALGVLALGLAAGAHGDIFHLTNGGMLEGELIEQTPEIYRIRTTVGIVTLGRDAVREIVESESPFEVYDRRVAELNETADEHFALAEWCAENSLGTERRRHLSRCLELDPNHAGARRALGYVRVGMFWVEARTVVDRGSRNRRSEADDVNGEQVIAAIQGQWYRQIRAIRDNLLGSPQAKHIEEGRQKILAIEDPLAIAPLAEVLSEGSLDCRAVLVEALSRSPTDEATMNLAILALTDGDAELRRLCVVELGRRNDSRVAAQFRNALSSGSEALIRRGAEALGHLGDRGSVPDLIDQLRVERRKRVEVPVRTYFDRVQQVYSNGMRVTLGAGTNVRYMPRIGVATAGDFVRFDTEFRVRDVTVFRTEVLEALKAITGQNFGFDVEAWRRWHEEQT